MTRKHWDKGENHEDHRTGAEHPGRHNTHFSAAPSLPGGAPTTSTQPRCGQDSGMSLSPPGPVSPPGKRDTSSVLPQRPLGRACRDDGHTGPREHKAESPAGHSGYVLLAGTVLTSARGAQPRGKRQAGAMEEGRGKAFGAAGKTNFFLSFEKAAARVVSEEISHKVLRPPLDFLSPRGRAPCLLPS